MPAALSTVAYMPLTVKSFSDACKEEVFSFEKEYLEKYTGSKNFYGVVNKAYFIDIGIPEDYQQFKEDYGPL